MASDPDTLAEPTPVGYVHVERTGPGWRLVEDEGMAPDASLIAAGWANEAVGVVYLHNEVKGWRPPARVITTAAELDALPDRTVVLDCDGDAWRRSPDLAGAWMVTGSDISHCAADVAEFAPLTLLYVPTEEETDDDDQ